MSLDLNTLEIVHNPDEKRFEIVMPDGQLAWIDYMLGGNNIAYTHTDVPTAYEGQGVASKLAHYAMEYAKEHGYKVQALCPVVARYVERHKEYQGITWGY